MELQNFKIIVQARTNSSRFPEKIVKPVEKNITFLHVLLSRLLLLKAKVGIVIATSNTTADNIIEEIGESFNIPVFRGSEENVLNRFIRCAEKYNISQIIRVCSDNPFIDTEMITVLIEKYIAEDYLSFSVNGNPSILTHYGFFSEIVSLDALKRLEKSNIIGCQEHVTNCIYSNQKEFNIKWIPLSIPTQNIRCTLDTKTDFEVLKILYFKWYKSSSPERLGYENLIEFIQSNPSLYEKMQQEINQNIK